MQVPSTAFVEKNAKFFVSKGLSWENSGVRAWGSDSPVRDELSTWRYKKEKNDRKYYNLCNELNYIRVLIGSFIIIMIFWRADAYMTSPSTISASLL